MIKLLKMSLGVALVAMFSSCWAVDHFQGDPSQYDNLFFGSKDSVSRNPVVKTDKWRNYAVFGLVPWDEAQLQFAGTRLGAIPTDSRPVKIYVRSEESVLNVLAGFGVSLVGGILGPLLFVPRLTEVTAWTDG